MSNVRVLPAATTGRGQTKVWVPPPPPAYAELAVTTNFSFLRSGSSPEEMMLQAEGLGLAGIGIADRNSVAGVVRAYSMLMRDDDLKARKSNDRDGYGTESDGQKERPAPLIPAQAGIQGGKEKAGSRPEPVLGQAEGATRGPGRAEPEAPPRALKLAVGARLVFADGTPDILAYPHDRAAWGRLTSLLTVGKSRGDKAECILFLDDLVEYARGLNLIVMPPSRIKTEPLVSQLLRLKEASRKFVWLGAGILYRGDDNRRLSRLMGIADKAKVPLIAINDVLYHAPERRALQDVVTCIREHVTIETAGRHLEANAERHLKSPHEMTRLFRRAPEAIDQTIRFLDRCKFSLGELKFTEYPDESRQGFANPQEALTAFVENGARERYGETIPSEVRNTLDKELAITADLQYARYFLTVHDIVRFAKSKGILCQGRGSAANSVICYCLGITEVDPTKVKLLFERFVSAARKEPPDIDVDFEHERREEVIQYIYNKYGREHAGMTATVICYRGRSAIREVGKVFGLSEDTVGALAGTLWGWSMDGVGEKEAKRIGFDPSDPRLKMVMELTQELMGFPRHLSQHVGGFVITRSRLDAVVPVENAAMEDRTVIEWDKDDLDILKLLKVDVLGLGMLSCLRRSFDLMKGHYPKDGRGAFKLADIPVDDEASYKMMTRADTIGVFQIESRAQMSMLPRLQPKEFYDLVIEVAIVRPGPIQGNMVHPYLKRREALRERGDEPEYPSPSPEHGHKDELKDVLKRTLGVPLFQEQAMSIAIVAAKFAPDRADLLRRAMATFRRVGTINRYKHDFINGMANRGYPRDFAERCFAQIEGFGEYGFPESHAASFALLVYTSAWLKCHYPDVFAAALLNSQPMGFYAPAQIVRDAQEHGVEVRPADINLSDWDCGLEPNHRSSPRTREPLATLEAMEESSERSLSMGPRLREDDRISPAELHPRYAAMKDDIWSTHALRLGLRQVSGLSKVHGERIESVRGRGFDSIRDLWLRTRLPPAALERLADADAFRSLGLDRREALWAVRALQRAGDKDDLPLFARVAMPELEPDVALPPMRPGEHVIEDYRHLHLSLKAHPVSFLRNELDARGITRHSNLTAVASGLRVTVAGLVLVRQRPGSAKAIFMTLEDETGIANTIVWLRTFETYRPVVLGARLISVTGLVQNESGVIHIVADHMEDLSPLLRRLAEDPACVRILTNADELKHDHHAKRAAMLRQRHPRAGDALVVSLKDRTTRVEDFNDAGNPVEVMPKGRNFH